MAAVTGVPADLSADGRKRFKNIKAWIEDDRGWEDIYHPLLDSYVRALEVADQAWLAMGGRRGGGPLKLIGEGGAGQPVSSPEWKVWCEAKRAAKEFAAELGLTPKARAALGDATVKPSGSKFGL
jgi:phage terminase small subunit